MEKSLIAVKISVRNRRNSMAKRGINIYKRKDGRWEGRYIQGRKASGRAKYGYVYGRSYTECREKLKAAEVQKKTPPKCKCTLTVKELFSQLLQKRAGDVKESTLARYRFLIERHILPALGELTVNKLTAERLQSFLNEKRANGRCAAAVCLRKVSGTSVSWSDLLCGWLRRFFPQWRPCPM